jgi:hypothetical protein
MSTIRKDDRTPGQKETHRWAIVGTDKCLSGWGEAEGMPSYAAWSAKPDHLEAVRRWVAARGDMIRVREVDLRNYHPEHCHLHIYVVDPEHPALA